MQLKNLFFTAAAVVVCSAHSIAQLDSEVAPLAMKVTGTDTLVMPKGYKPKKQPLAANLPLPNPADFKPAERKPVPRAGQKEYFGDMNEYVNNYVRQYLRAHNKTLSVVQNRAEVQFPLIDNILKQHDIPKELKYLAVIESALNNKALSRVGAYGPWQFMSGTAQLMGLTVNKKRDERTDWYRSTNAAAKYLSVLYDQLNDWLLVVAAYNSGPAPVLRAIQRTGSSDFFEIKKYLPRETQGHVLAFIATTSIFENLDYMIGKAVPEDFDITGKPVPGSGTTPAKPKFTQEELASMAVVKVKDALSLDFMAEELKMDKRLLNKWNEDYDLFLTGTYSDEAYSLRIPKDKLESFLEKKAYLVTRSKKILDEQAL